MNVQPPIPGLATLAPMAVRIRPPGHLLVHNVAMTRDAYRQAKNDQSVHAQTV